MPMNKPAETSQPLIAVIRDRWSPRAFTDRMVPKDVLTSLFEAARWAASCNNAQPWRFIVATKENRAEYDRLLSCFNDRNQSWAITAPIIMITCADRNLPNGSPSNYGFYDTGAAMAQFTAQAMSHGVVVHQAQGILPDKIREEYAVPDDFEVCTGIALGYQAEADVLPDDYAKREVLPRDRKPLEELVFSGGFGKPSKAIG